MTMKSSNKNSEVKEMKSVDAARRKLLAGGAAFATVALAPGVMLISAQAATPAPGATPASGIRRRASGVAANPKIRWGMLIDTTKCAADCDVCVVACKVENGWGVGHGRPATDVQWIRIVNIKNPKTGAKLRLPVFCQHCGEPPCVDVCPTGASFKRADGIVLVDKHICIGCRYCMMACPYKARSFVHEDVTNQNPLVPRGKGSVESCTFCVQRVDAGRLPACVEACNEKVAPDALIFGDLNDPESKIAKTVSRYVTTRIRADLGLDVGVSYLGF